MCDAIKLEGDDAFSQSDEEASNEAADDDD
jgi:hypothetical protein